MRFGLNFMFARRKANLAGYVDRIEANEISGWVADLSSPGKAVEVEILVNGRPASRIKPSLSRKDADAAGYSGARGFQFCPAPHLVSGKNRVEVIFAATRQHIRGGRAEIDYGISARVDNFWSAKYSPSGETDLTLCWWQCDAIIRHVNARVCGVDVPGLSQGLYQLMPRRFGSRLPLARAVSVGCGFGRKEADAINSLVIDAFDLFELSSEAVKRGRDLAAGEGLADRMHFQLGDAFRIVEETQVYDAVFWNNSLHHMLDVDAALEWSYRVLKPGGVLILDDYVGPTLMQWSDRLCDINTQYRRSLPKKYLADPQHPGHSLPVEVRRPDKDSFVCIDPSEGADSERIIPSIRKYFPSAEIIPTGGGIYLLGLNVILHNLIAAGDTEELSRALKLDDRCVEIGESPYAVALAIKE